MQDEKIDLKWGQFSAKLGLAVATLVAGAIATKLFEDGTETKLIIGAGLLAFVIATIALTFRRASHNPDEFERRIETLALAQAGLWVVLYLIIMTAMSYMDRLNIDHISVFLGPGAMMIYQVLTSQFLRRNIALGKPNTLAKFL